MSEEEPSEILDPQNMKGIINLDSYLPHQCLFLDDTISLEDKYKKTFFYATLYLITNNKFLMRHFLLFHPDNNKEKIFYNMIKNINDDVKDNANSKEKNNYESINAINDYKKSLNNEINDPRNILIRILLKTMKRINLDSSSSSSEIVVRNLFSEGDEKKSKGDIATIIEYLSNVGSNLLISDIEKSIENSWILLDKYIESEIENEGMDIVIKITADGKDKYRFSSYIKFNLKEKTEIYTLENCFKNYLDEIRHISIQKKVYYKFPESIIILLFFGKNEENIQEYKYEFEEVLDFSEPEYIDYLDEKIRNKKYILGGLVACKFPKNIYKEFFYTFYRKYPNKENSSFYIYNSKEKKVKEVPDVNNKLKKDKKEDGTRSYPYILIYNEIKD